MSDPYIGEIKVISFNFPPKGWAFCNGQLLPINQNQALFSILGTTYGGDGQTNFALPNLQGRMPMHAGATASHVGQARRRGSAHADDQPRCRRTRTSASASSAPATPGDRRPARLASRDRCAIYARRPRPR